GKDGRGLVVEARAAPDRRRLHVSGAVAGLLPQDPTLSDRGRPRLLARDDDRGPAHGGPTHRGAGELLSPARRGIEALGEPLAQHAHRPHDAEPDRAQVAEPALRRASVRQTRSETSSEDGRARSPARARSATSRDDSGRQRAGSVGPKTTAPRAPTAPARWLTPLSLPTWLSLMASSAATSDRLHPRATAAPSSGVSPASAGPRSSTTSPRHRRHHPATAAKPSAAQRLACAPAPRCTTSSGRPRSAASVRARADSGGVTPASAASRARSAGTPAAR